MFAIDGLHKVCPEFPTYSHDVIETFLCNPARRECWLNQCQECEDLQKFIKDNVLEEHCEATWFLWKNDEEGRITKAVQDGSNRELAEYISSLIPQFAEHCFVKRQQAAAFNLERETAISERYVPNKALVQIDFSENYTCVSQDEIQAAHWNQKQVSLFTTAMWYDGRIHSQVTASNNITHSKETVVAYIDKLLDDLPIIVKLVLIWSDGPSSQFKNRFISASIPVLQKKHGVQLHGISSQRLMAKVL